MTSKKKTKLQIATATDLDNMAASFMVNASRIAEMIRRGNVSTAIMSFGLSKFDGRPGTPMNVKINMAAVIRDGVQLEPSDKMTVADAEQRLDRWVDQKVAA